MGVDILNALAEDTLLTPTVGTPQSTNVNAEYYRSPLP